MLDAYSFRAATILFISCYLSLTHITLTLQPTHWYSVSWSCTFSIFFAWNLVIRRLWWCGCSICCDKMCFPLNIEKESLFSIWFMWKSSSLLGWESCSNRVLISPNCFDPAISLCRSAVVKEFQHVSLTDWEELVTQAIRFPLRNCPS